MYQPLIAAWLIFLAQHTWQDLIKNCPPSSDNGCGIVYDFLPNPLNRKDESFAIVDMRKTAVAEPHYHPDVEIYFVLQGKALVVIGHEKHHVGMGDVVVIPPYKAHYALPNNEFVIACVNTPPFTPDKYIPLTASNNAVEFDYDEFKQLTSNLINPILVKNKATK